MFESHFTHIVTFVALSVHPGRAFLHVGSNCDRAQAVAALGAAWMRRRRSAKDAAGPPCARAYDPRKADEALVARALPEAARERIA
jgi:hypothetical protein